MRDIPSNDMNEIMKSLPGGLLRVVLDNELTIVFANDAFYELINFDNNKTAMIPENIVKTVYSTDIIYYTHQIAEQRKRKDDQLLLFYRVLLKNGELRWIMINGNKTEDIYQKHNKSYPIYLCMALDVTDHMMKYRKLEDEVDYHRTVSELSKELYFEYEIASDTITFASLFREVFGKESTISNFSRRLERTTLVYPADLPYVIKIYKSIMSGKKQLRCEFRMVTKDGEATWYVCYASIIFDENKTPYKVIGKLSAVYTRAQEVEEKPYKIQMDKLTDVYNKETAEQLITDTLLSQDPDTLSAILYCEVRNYKNINDIVRVVDGENILSTVANILKRSFRSTDIIGRMSLSEFVILMIGINSDKNAYRRAEDICREVNNLYSYNFNKNQVNISIGITFVKGSQDYSTSIANAKTALVMSKKDSSSSFEAFYPAKNN